MGTGSTGLLRDTRTTALGVAGFAGIAQRALALGATVLLLGLPTTLASAALSPRIPRATV